MRENLHIYFADGYYKIFPNALCWMDLTGWYENNAVLWRKKFERQKTFEKRCRKHIKLQNGRFMSAKKASEIVRKNIEKILVDL